MSNTAQLAADIHALAVLAGSKLIAAEKLCNSGADWTGKELTKLAGEINNLNGLLNGVYYTAKQLLSEDDFQQFVYRSGIDRAVIESGIESAEEAIATQP